MNRELRVYNQDDGLILHLDFIADDALPLQIVDGTPEMQQAVRSLFGQDFDQTVVINRQTRHFTARWGEPDYIDALAGYWSSNFGWRTKIIDKAQTWAAFTKIPVVALSNVITADFVDLRASRLATLAAETGKLQDIPDIYVGEIADLWQGSILESGCGMFAEAIAESPTVVNLEPLQGNLTLELSAFPASEPFVIANAIENNPAEKPSQLQVLTAA